MSTIDIRGLRTIQRTIPICQELRNSINIVDVSIDFSNLAFATPLATAFFARELKYFVAQRSLLGLKTYVKGYNSDCEAISYLKFIGFFDFIGCPSIGEQMRTRIYPRATYVPITKYMYKRFEPDLTINPSGQPVDLIDPEAREISRLFTIDSHPHKIIQYIICEIMRNAFEHSKTDFIYVCGQYWKNGAIELTISDNGIGILTTLKQKYPNLLTQEEAIKKSLEPGVSCADFDVSKNKYSNSGFGLYVISELARKFGSFFIASKDAAMQFQLNSIKHYTTVPEGTLICIRIDNIWARDYEKEIDEIISSGKTIAAQGEYPSSPSKHTLSYKK